MARVQISDKTAQALRSAPVAKGKVSRNQREAERELETDVKVIRTKKTDANAKAPLHYVPGGSVKSLMEETMARVYGEIYPGYSTHDEDTVPVLDIQEEAYVLTLTMYVGNDIDTPRTGLSLKEDAKASENMKSCKACS